jgi:hypothetical protein
MAGGARPQTAEIIKTFGERCPEVKVNNKQERADYIVVLDHEGGKGPLRHKNKVAVFNRASGDSIVGKSTLSLGGSVQEACEAITRDWSEHGASIRAVSATSQEKLPPPATPTAATTSTAKLQIDSTPAGADIEIDGSFVGSTPSNVQVAEGDHMVAVKKSGFKSWERKLKSSAGSSVHISSELEKADTHSTCGNCASLIQEQKGAPKRSLVCLTHSKISKLLVGAFAHFGFLGRAEGESVLLAGEAYFGNDCFAAGMVYERRVVVGCFIEVDEFCRSFRDFLLALHNPYFDIRSGAVPAQLILTGGELLAGDFGRLMHPQRTFVACESTRCEQHGQPEHNSPCQVSQCQIVQFHMLLCFLPGFWPGR